MIKDNGLVLDRRQLLAGAAALGLSTSFGSAPAFAETPKKGGTLRLGMEGGSASDSLDPTTYSSGIPINIGMQLFNALVEIDNTGKATPELLESWETKPGAEEWIFNVRKGVTFGSGKTLNADDIIYSINLHRGESKSGAKGLLEPIKEIKKLSDSQIQITLNGGNADLPYILSDFHIVGLPDGFKDFSKPDGTGAYALESFEPGVRALTKRKDGAYWKEGRGNFDGVELRYLVDTAARMQALITGEVDAINNVDPKTAKLVMQSKKVKIVQTKGAGYRRAFVAHVDQEPFSKRDLMLALKYAIDRQKIIDNVYNGFAALGNDHLIGSDNPYFDANQPQRAYDPAKAAEHYKKSGHSGPITLKVSEGAYPGATDAAVLFQESAKAAGIELNVERVSGDGYWDNVWLKAPFCAVYWVARPTADMQFSQTFMSTADWNDSKYKSEAFDKLVISARTELDDAKRKEIYAKAQAMVSDEAGMICFCLSDMLDGYADKVMGMKPHGRQELDDHRIAEKAWFA